MQTSRSVGSPKAAGVPAGWFRFRSREHSVALDLAANGQGLIEPLIPILAPDFQRAEDDIVSELQRKKSLEDLPALRPTQASRREDQKVNIRLRVARTACLGTKEDDLLDRGAARRTCTASWMASRSFSFWGMSSIRLTSKPRRTLLQTLMSRLSRPVPEPNRRRTGAASVRPRARCRASLQAELRLRGHRHSTLCVSAPTLSAC